MVNIIAMFSQYTKAELTNACGPVDFSVYNTVNNIGMGMGLQFLRIHVVVVNPDDDRALGTGNANRCRFLPPLPIVFRIRVAPV